MRDKLLIHKQSPERFAPGDTGHHEPAPFIVGCARSGTTLLRLVLDAHPDLAIPDETHFIPKLTQQCRDSDDPRREFFETFPVSPGYARLQLDNGLFFDSVSRINPFDLGSAIRATYQLYSKKFGKSRWGEKTPSYSSHMSLIQGLLPEARFIHIIRDGRDVALSIKDFPRLPRSHVEAAAWWKQRIEQARGQVDLLHNYLEIRFEDLVLQMEPTVRQVCDFLELSWDPRMLTYYQTSEERLHLQPVGVSEPRRRAHALTARPPQGDRVGVWRREMEQADLASFDAIAGDTLKEFGYSLAGEETAARTVQSR